MMRRAAGPHPHPGSRGNRYRYRYRVAVWAAPAACLTPHLSLSSLSPGDSHANKSAPVSLIRHKTRARSSTPPHPPEFVWGGAGARAPRLSPALSYVVVPLPASTRPRRGGGLSAGLRLNYQECGGRCNEEDLSPFGKQNIRNVLRNVLGRDVMILLN